MKKSKQSAKFVLFVGLVLCLVSFLISCNSQETNSQISNTQSDQNALDSSLVEMVAARNIPKNDLKIVISKSKYTLHVEYKNEILISYPCVFGFNPIDDKHEEGDGCTPEGEFKIRSKYAHKSWKYFIWIDYPTQESWRRFNDRKSKGEISENGTIGGEIGIHGVPEGTDDMISDKTNWTLGCISLTRQSITDLYKSIGDKTKITILH